MNGEKEGDLLVVGWGGTEGALASTVTRMQAAGANISHAHFNYIKPLPKNTREVLSSYKKVIVCELNGGQFVNYLRMNYPDIPFHQYNKVQGLPFHIQELTETFTKLLEE